MMKRILYAAFVLLLATSCFKEIPYGLENLSDEPTVPVILSFKQPITLQPRTKADRGMEMGVNPAISSIHVAVFGSSGYLKDYVSATPCDVDGNPVSNFVSTNNTTAYFLVRLPVNNDDKARRVHIIANGPTSLPFNAYEDDIMQNLSVTDGNGAYWQRLLLSNGISAVQDPDSGEFSPTTETTTAFSDLKLMRNFAGVKVTSSAANFELVSYTLCNMSKSGAVAIYSASHKDEDHDGWISTLAYSDPTSFAFDTDTDPNPGFLRYDSKVYPGFPTNPVLETSIPSTEEEYNAAGVAVGPDETIYVYERAVTASNPPFILMAGRWVKTGNIADADPKPDIKYYRLDITKDDAYIPLYRNYNYHINLAKVEVQGYDDPGTASQHNSGDNFSVSVDTQTLPNVSNGIIRIYVEQPYYDLIYTSEQQEFWFQLLLNSDSSYINDNVTVTELDGGNAVESFTKENTDRTGNKRYVTYSLNEPTGSSVLTSTFRLVGTYDDGEAVSKLSREVTIRVFNAKEVHPTLTPNTVAPQAGEYTTLGIPLPLDFERSMFPMELMIEDSAKALNPTETENMPVKTLEKSLTDNTRPSYCFVRTLNWSEYERLRKDAELSGKTEALVNCEFETIKAFTSTTVYVYNKFFATNNAGVTTAQVILNTDASNLITPNRQTITGTSAAVTVKSSGDWTLSIALANGSTATGTTISPNSGSSTSEPGEPITITLPENDTKNAIRYKLTLYNTTYGITRSAYVTQRGTRMELSTSETEVTYAASDVGVTVESGLHYILEVHAGGEVRTFTNGGAPWDATVEPTPQTVIIPENNTVSDREVTIRLRNTAEPPTMFEDVTIIQRAATAEFTADDIAMSQTDATVNVVSNIATVLKVYNASDELVAEQNVPSTSSVSTPVAVTIGANNTGEDRTFTVKMYNESGTLLRTGTFTQLGTSMLRWTPAESNVGNTSTSVSLNLVSEANNWSITEVTTDGDAAFTTSSVSPSSGSATGVSGTTVNVAIPDNILTSPVTYTVTASDGTKTAEATIQQAAGIATLSIVDNSIHMSETSATIDVVSSFPTKWKVYDANGDFVSEAAADIPASPGGTDVEVTGFGANTPGDNRSFRVDLCNASGTVLASGTFTQSGTPVFTLTPASSSVKGNESATLTLVSEVAWSIDAITDVTFAVGSGSATANLSGDATGLSGTTITVNMPVNYTTTDDDVYTVTARGTGSNSSLNGSAEITHRKATALNGQTFNFAPNLYSSPNTSVTRNGMTAAYQRIVGYNNSNNPYLEINSSSNTSTTLTLSILDNAANGMQVMKISKVYVDYSTGFGPGSTNSSPSGISNSTNFGLISNSTWTGTLTSGNLVLTFGRRTGLGAQNTRIAEVTVTYDAVRWD